MSEEIAARKLYMINTNTYLNRNCTVCAGTIERFKIYDLYKLKARLYVHRHCTALAEFDS